MLSSPTSVLAQLSNRLAPLTPILLEGRKDKPCPQGPWVTSSLPWALHS